MREDERGDWIVARVGGEIIECRVDDKPRPNARRLSKRIYGKWVSICDRSLFTAALQNPINTWNVFSRHLSGKTLQVCSCS